MATKNVENPPSVEPINTIDLLSTKDSNISGVSVYSGRAEITRLFKFTVKTGQNQVTIKGLPNVLDEDSVRSVFNLIPEAYRFEIAPCLKG